MDYQIKELIKKIEEYDSSLTCFDPKTTDGKMQLCEYQKKRTDFKPQRNTLLVVVGGCLKDEIVLLNGTSRSVNIKVSRGPLGYAGISKSANDLCNVMSDHLEKAIEEFRKSMEKIYDDINILDQLSGAKKKLDG